MLCYMGLLKRNIDITVKLEIFARVLFSRKFVRSLVKINPSQNGEITSMFTDVGKSVSGHEFLMSQICSLTLFAKIKFSPKFSEFTGFNLLNYRD